MKRIMRNVILLGQSVVINMAVLSIWYASEYIQFGELQFNRKCDNVVFELYILIIYALLVKACDNKTK